MSALFPVSDRKTSLRAFSLSAVPVGDQEILAVAREPLVMGTGRAGAQELYAFLDKGFVNLFLQICGQREVGIGDVSRIASKALN